jgi:hypothetical protein
MKGKLVRIRAGLSVFLLITLAMTAVVGLVGASEPEAEDMICIVEEGNISDHLWSPDGTQIAYIVNPEGQYWNGELWIADWDPCRAEVTDKRLVKSGVEWGKLEDWKDDWILFLPKNESHHPSGYYGHNELWKIRTDGSDLTQITFTYTNGIKYTENGWYINRGSCGWGRFIPGTDLVYFTAHNGNGWYKAFTCKDDGTDQYNPISDGHMAFTVGLSPTGNKLLYGHATYWNNPTYLYSTNVDGSVKQFLKYTGYRFYPLVLADGNTIVWHFQGNLFAMNMDGSGTRTVLDDAYTNWWTNYDPLDPQSLLMLSDRDPDGNMHVFSLNIDTTEIEQLTEGPYNDEAPFYSPDGRYLLYRRLPEAFDPGSAPPWTRPSQLVVKTLVPTFEVYEGPGWLWVDDHWEIGDAKFYVPQVEGCPIIILEIYDGDSMVASKEWTITEQYTAGMWMKYTCRDLEGGFLWVSITMNEPTYVWAYGHGATFYGFP